MNDLIPIAFTVNARPTGLSVPPSRLLIDLIRDDLGLKGTKPGCLEGECGACTVLVDGAPVNSCLYLAVTLDGKTLQTVEGLGATSPDAGLDRVQEALIIHGAIQCGFCTPGMVMAIKAYESDCRENSLVPGRAEIGKALSGNLCRCTGYVKIIDAVESLFREP